MNDSHSILWALPLLCLMVAGPAIAQEDAPAKIKAERVTVNTQDVEGNPIQIDASGGVEVEVPKQQEKAQEVAEQVAFLGVGTQAVPQEVRAQVDLPRHAGLSVVTVMPDSPAASVGLAEHDILTKIDDQWIINPPQFQALIRMHDPGDTLTLTYLRKGKSNRVKVALGGRPVEAPQQTIFGRWVENAEPVVISVPSYPHLRKRYQKLLEELQKSLPDKEQIKQKTGQISEDVQKRIDMLQDRIREIQKEMGIDVDAPDRQAGVRPNVPHDGALTASQLVMRKSDDQHRITLTVRDDIDKHLHVEDARGKLIFDGLINTPEERQAVPEDIMAKVEKMEQNASSHVRIRIHGRRKAPAPAAQPEAAPQAPAPPDASPPADPDAPAAEKPRPVQPKGPMI